MQLHWLHAISAIYDGQSVESDAAVLDPIIIFNSPGIRSPLRDLIERANAIEIALHTKYRPNAAHRSCCIVLLLKNEWKAHELDRIPVRSEL